MNKIYSYKSGHIPASIKDIDGKKGIVTGYFSCFDNVDADGDIIRKGAFTKTIMEAGPLSSNPRIKHLLNHNSSQPLGKILSLTEDMSGLAYESQIGSHTLGQDFIKMVESDLIAEHSIGFQTLKTNKLKDGTCEITEIKLWEGSSLTAWGANPNTPLTGLKSETREEFLQNIVNRQKNLEKFCRNSTASDETIELLLIENKQLTQYIIDNTQPVTATEPKEDLKVYADGINNYLKHLKAN